MATQQELITQRTIKTRRGMEITEALRLLDELPHQPAAMTYFKDFFRMIVTEKSDFMATDKIVATTCIQVPEEIVYAAGARPYRICSGSYGYDQIGAELMPAKSCSLARATVGMMQFDEHTRQDNVLSLVIPTTCDQKKKCHEFGGDMSSRIYQLEMPSSKESDAASFYWQETVKQFALDLQKFTGKKISRKSLQKAIDNKQKASHIYRKITDLQHGNGAVIHGSDILLLNNCYFMDRQEQWIKAAQELLAEMEERQKSEVKVCTPSTPRLLLTGSPAIFPNFKVPILIEQSGGLIVADEFCSSSRLLHDAVSYDENRLDEMISALADRYLKPCTCPCLTPNEDRKRRILNLVKESDADGVVYQALSGCFPYEMEQIAISRILEKNNIPMLYLETDYSPEDMGQLSTRVEAFIESIRIKRRKKILSKKESGERIQ